MGGRRARRINPKTNCEPNPQTPSSKQKSESPRLS
jgi:hypothetical protein